MTTLTDKLRRFATTGRERNRWSAVVLNGYHAEILDEAADLIERQAKAIDEAREALEPFKREWLDMGIAHLPDEKLVTEADDGGDILTVGHWRALMAALTTLSNGGEDGR